MSGITKLVSHITLPRFAKVEQHFPRTDMSPEAVTASLDQAFAKPEIAGRIKPGQQICITAGSRGISNMPLVTRYLVDKVRALGPSKIRPSLEADKVER